MHGFVAVHLQPPPVADPWRRKRYGNTSASYVYAGFKDDALTDYYGFSAQAPCDGCGFMSREFWHGAGQRLKILCADNCVRLCERDCNHPLDDDGGYNK